MHHFKLRQITKNVAARCNFEAPKNHMRFRPGLCPGPHCRSLHSYPRPSSWFLEGRFAVGEEREETGMEAKAGDEKGGEHSLTSFFTI